MKYRVYKIEHNYNQIWHEIKANKNIVVNYNFTILKCKVFPYFYSLRNPIFFGSSYSATIPEVSFLIMFVIKGTQFDR